MNDISKIDLYHNLFLGCLIVFFICAAIAAVLFFVLEIRKVIGYLTGRTAKRQIERLETENDLSGQMRKKNHSSMQKVDKKMQREMGVKGTALPGARKVENAVQAAQETELPVCGEKETSLLESGSTEKIEMYSNVPEKSTLEETILLQKSDARNRTFRIEREIMLIHTEEVI